MAERKLQVTPIDFGKVFAKYDMVQILSPFGLEAVKVEVLERMLTEMEGSLQDEAIRYAKECSPPVEDCPDLVELATLGAKPSKE